MNRAALDVMHDQRMALRVICRGLTLPFWLPFWWRTRRRRRREFMRFVLDRRDRGIVDARRVALEWANERPRQFPFGEYDPGLKKLEPRIRAILERHG